MKPVWEDAPPWAQWLAMDEDGEWYWYELEPDNKAFGWDRPEIYGERQGRVRSATPVAPNWIETKEQRK